MCEINNTFESCTIFDANLLVVLLQTTKIHLECFILYATKILVCVWRGRGGDVLGELEKYMQTKILGVCVLGI